MRPDLIKEPPSQSECERYESWLYEECREYDLKGMPQEIQISLRRIHEFTEYAEKLILTNENGKALPDLLELEQIEDLNRDKLVGAIYYRGYKLSGTDADKDKMRNIDGIANMVGRFNHRKVTDT